MRETERAAPRPRLPHAAAINSSMATTARQVRCGFRLSGKSFPATEMARKVRLTGLMMPLSKVQDSRIGSVPPYLPPTTPNPAISRRAIMPFFLIFRCRRRINANNMNVDLKDAFYCSSIRGFHIRHTVQGRARVASTALLGVVGD